MNATIVVMTPLPEDRLDLPSASGIERVMLCPGSWMMEKNLPSVSSPQADSGVRIHYARAIEDHSWLEEAEAGIADRCKEIEKSLVDQWLVDTGLSDLRHVLWVDRERRVWIQSKGGSKIASAQMDVCYRSQDSRLALILDDKTGRKHQTAPIDNWQLKTAVVALKNEYPQLESVRVAIIQPLAKKQPACDYDETAMQSARVDILAGLVRAYMEGDAPLNPGPRQCDYCKAKATCPAALAQTKSLVTFKSWAVLPPEKKVEAFEACQVATKLIAEIKANIKADLISNPESIPGLKMGKDQNPREISDLVGCLVDLLKNPHLAEMPDDEIKAKFVDACSMSIGDGVKMLQSLTGCTKKEADEFFTNKPWIKLGQKSGSIEKV